MYVTDACRKVKAWFCSNRPCSVERRFAFAAHFLAADSGEDDETGG